MSSFDLYEDGFPHGTAEGYKRGCRGSACPAGIEHGLSCKVADTKSHGDFTYQRLARSGASPAEIAAQLHVATVTPITSKKRVVIPDIEDDEPVVEQEEPTMTITAPSPATILKSKKPAPAAATVVRIPPTPAPASGRTKEELAAIRQWAHETGVPCGTKGRIAAAVIAAYDNSVARPTQTLGGGEASEGDHPRSAGPSAAVAPEPITVVPDAGAPFSPETMDHFPDEPTPAVGPKTQAFRIPDVEPAPRVGMRARPRHDDGVAVVREVQADAVRVTFLPDVHDDEARETLDWLNDIGPWYPAVQFAFDEFHSASTIHHELAQWAEAQLDWAEAVAEVQATVAADPEAVLAQGFTILEDAATASAAAERQRHELSLQEEEEIEAAARKALLDYVAGHPPVPFKVADIMSDGGIIQTRPVDAADESVGSLIEFPGAPIPAEPAPDAAYVALLERNVEFLLREHRTARDEADTAHRAVEFLAFKLADREHELGVWMDAWLDAAQDADKARSDLAYLRAHPTEDASEPVKRRWFRW